MEQPELYVGDLRTFVGSLGRPVAGSGRADFRLFLDLVAQKYRAVFERGGLDQLSGLPILENAHSLTPGGRASPLTRRWAAVLLRGDLVDANPLLDYEFSHGANLNCVA
jgi:hypothetical protein